MRHYRTQKIEIKKLDEIICNCCGKKISVIVRTAMTGSYLDFQYL